MKNQTPPLASIQEFINTTRSRQFAALRKRQEHLASMREQRKRYLVKARATRDANRKRKALEFLEQFPGFQNAAGVQGPSAQEAKAFNKVLKDL
jgi:hypothetical protein